MNTMRSKYRVECDRGGCGRCGAGAMWTIIRPDDVGFSQSWSDKEFVDELADMLNEAYEAGARAISASTRDSRRACRDDDCVIQRTHK